MCDNKNLCMLLSYVSSADHLQTLDFMFIFFRDSMMHGQVGLLYLQLVH